MHAEVRTKDAFDVVGRNDVDAFEKRHRSGRLDAIVAICGPESSVWASLAAMEWGRRRCSVMLKPFEKLRRPDCAFPNAA